MFVHGRTSVYNISYHFVFVTKYRQAIFETEQQQKDLLAILTEIADKKEITIQKAEVVTDHVHIMATVPPKIALSSAVKSLKGTSAREWFKLYPETKQKLWDGHLWSPSYFVSTLGNISKEIVAQYIENQHKK